MKQLEELKLAIINQYGEQSYDNIKMLLARIESNYINHFKSLSEFQRIIKIEDWCDAFSNISYEILLGAYRNYRLVNESHPPSIAHINKELYGMVDKESNIADESFEKIFPLISRFGTSTRGYERALPYFTEIEQKVLTKSYWKELGMDVSLRSVIKGQYVRLYNDIKEETITSKRKSLNALNGKFLDRKKELIE